MKKIEITKFIESTNLNDAMLVGYYGGGNYGDELLLEILINLLDKNNFKKIKIMYLDRFNYEMYHRKISDYEVVSIKKFLKFCYLSIKSKSIIVGGGGIWGLDFNRNVLLFSLYLFLMRFIFFKKIYLLGIGFYNSTSKSGKIMGKITGLSSSIIIARDEETYQNFLKVSNDVYLGKDIAFDINEVQISKYEVRTKEFENMINLKSNKTILFVLRGFDDNLKKYYRNIIKEYVSNNLNLNFILAIMENKDNDKDNYKFIKDMGDNLNIPYFYFSFNPMVFYYFLKSNKEKIVIIAPQFHIQLVSFLAGVKFLPISYDNKCEELFKILKIDNFIKIKKMKIEHLDNFIKNLV